MRELLYEEPSGGPEGEPDRAAWLDEVLETASAPLETLAARVEALERENARLQDQTEHAQSAQEVLRNENERLRGRLAGSRDLESAAQRAEEFRTLAENSPDGILRIDRDLRVRYVNQAVVDSSGLSREALLNLSNNDIAAFEPALPYLNLLQETLESGKRKHLELSAHLSGEMRWFEVDMTPETGPDGQVESVLVVSREITRRKKAEEGLRQTEERFRITTESAGMAVFEQDRALVYTWVHNPLDHMLILPVGQRDNDIFSAAEAARLTAIKRRVLRTGRRERHELPLTTRLGPGYFDLILEPLRDPQGKVCGILGAVMDITARQQLELENEQQHASLERQRDLLETILSVDPGGVAVVAGLEAKFVMANSAYRAITPYPEVDLIGRRMDEIWPPEEGFRGAELLHTVLEDEASLSVERLEHRYPDGSLRSFTLHARPITWEGQPGAVLISWETTEQEKAFTAARQALEEARHRAAEAEEGRRTLDALMEYIPEGVVVTSAPDQHVLYASKYAAGLLGLSRAQVEGQPVRSLIEDLEVYRSDGHTRLSLEEAPPVSALRSGEVIIDDELLVGQGELKINLLVTAGPIRDGEGRVFASVTTVRDVSERRREVEHQRFLSELGRALVALRSPEEVKEGLAYRLGRYLGADRCLITEEEESGGRHIIQHDYHPGQNSAAGQYSLDLFPDALIERLSHGKLVVIADTQLDPLTEGPKGEFFSSGRVRAMLAAPWQGRMDLWKGTLVVACHEPRAWRQDEVQLIQSVADLARLALENAYLMLDLQEFRSRFEVALRSAPITVYTTDRDLRVTWVFNPRKAFITDQMLGKTPDETGLYLQDLALIDLERTVLENGKGQRRELYLTYQGELTWYDVTVEPLYDADGQTSGLTVAMMETTEMRRMEAESVRNLAHIEVQRRLIAERELERTRIARELHDGPLQDLIATNFGLVEAMDINEKEPRVTKMRAIQAMLHGQIKSLRRFCNELRPPVLAPFGLEKTIRSHTESLKELHPGLKVQLRLQRDGQRLSEEVRMTLYRIYQELMTNIIRHAQATQVQVRFRLEDGHVVLEVEDNGVGFPAPRDWVELARAGHLGLVGVQERAEMAGGRVEIDARPGHGTRVRVIVPRNP